MAAKKIYMEKPVSSGVLFWEVVLKKNETICKTGKVGSRCNENPPNQHPSVEEAQNFVKYLVEQKKKQGFAEVEGTVARARAVTPVLDNSLHSKPLPKADIPLGDRLAKKRQTPVITKKQLNGAKTTRPHISSDNTKVSQGPVKHILDDSPKVPGKRGRPPKAKTEVQPAKKTKMTEIKKPLTQNTKKTPEPKPAGRRGRPPKKKEPETKTEDAKEDDDRLSHTDTIIVTDSVCENEKKGVSPLIKSRGRPSKETTMETEADEDKEESMETSLSRKSTTMQLCEELEKTVLQSHDTVIMASTESEKKWQDYRENKPISETKTEIASPRVSLRDPSKRKMTSKYEIYKQETLSRKRRSSEMSEEEHVSPKPALIKRESTTAAICQGLSKTNLTKKPKANKPTTKPVLIKKLSTIKEIDQEKDDGKKTEPAVKARGRPSLRGGHLAGRGRPLLKSASTLGGGRVKTFAQAKITMLKPKRGRPTLMKTGSTLSVIKRQKATEAGKITVTKPKHVLKRKHSDNDEGSSPTKIIVLQKNEGRIVGTPMKRMSAAEFAAKLVASSSSTFVDQSEVTPVKTPLPPPSKLQLTPSRMSATPSQLLATPSKKEDSPQPVIKRRCIASDNELTIASEFGTVFKPSVDDWPAFIPAPVVWQVPLKKDDAVCNGQSILVEPDRCLIADDSGNVTELNSTAVPTRTWALPSGVHCMVENKFRIYAGCADGSIYEVSLTPRLLTQLEDFGKLLSIDCFQEYIAASDQQGKVALLNKKDGTIVWKTKSTGEFGWLVRIDESGVYHGHTKGVTKYSLHDGSRMYHTNTDDNVLDGVQHKDFLYVSCGPYVVKIDKAYGTVCRTYNKGAQYTGLVHSVAVGGGLVYAGGSKICCYDEVCGELVYCFDLPFNSTAIQYFSGRLFCVGTGLMSVIDFSPDNIEKAMDGEAIDPITIIPVVMPELPQPSSIAQSAQALNTIKVQRLTMKRE